MCRATIALLAIHAAVMISLASYRFLLGKRELRQSFLASLVGRLPIGVTGLAILILVQSSSGSFARGGAAAACYVSGLAALAPALGRLIDRLVLLVFSVLQGAPAWMSLAAAAGAGASFPPITVCMRTYLRQRLRSDGELAAAYSLEAVLIELIFIVGPMLVALFVALGSAALAVLFAALCGGAGSVLFLYSPALRDWRIEARSAGGFFGPLADPAFVALIGVIVCYSSAFGLMEVGITAYATEAGNAALAGLLLGLMSVGSACGGIAYGSRSWHLPLTRQFALTLALMGAGLTLLALPWQAWWFALFSVIAGVVMAPALTIQSMLIAKIARPEHSTEAFTWSASALLAGVGAGLAGGGVLLEFYRSNAALAASGAAAFAAALGARFLGRVT